jgi:hypothetical protein
MTGSRTARLAWPALLAAAYVLILQENLPGHLSLDSVISLAEGRTGQRITWGPPMYSAILGAFDRISPGTALYVAASLLILLGSWAILPSLRPRTLWTGPLALAAVVAVPQVVIYQGIVWKDVLFANLSIAALVSLAWIAPRWTRPRPRLAGIALMSLFLAFACLVRQNGFVVVIVAACAVAWIAGRSAGWRAALAWGAATLTAPLVLMAALNAITPVREAPGVASMNRGVRLVEQYDLAAALAANPRVPMPVLERADPADLKVLRREVPRVYSPVRSDTLDDSEAYGSVIWNLETDDIAAQWRATILADPLGYALRRAQIFKWVFATPVIDQCLPVHVGVSGPAEQMSLLHLSPRSSAHDVRLYYYTTWFLDTPAMSHVAYAAVALVVGLLLLIRRDPADLAMVGLLASGLAFAASFFVISLACDYRYLYFLDMAAITGVLYLALDPVLTRPKARRRARD